MIIETFPVGALQSNCTLIGDQDSGEVVVIDPGGDADRIMDLVATMGLKLTHILHTHGHVDHILMSGELKRRSDALLWLHPSDLDLWNNLEMQCAIYGFPHTTAPKPDRELEDGMKLPILDGMVIHTPGHSPGSCCFWFPDSATLISGDTLFYLSVGRTDLWGGDHQALVHSIKNKLYALDDHVHVVCGHGPDTTIGEEKAFNEVVRW